MENSQWKQMILKVYRINIVFIDTPSALNVYRINIVFIDTPCPLNVYRINIVFIDTPSPLNVYRWYTSLNSYGWGSP